METNYLLQRLERFGGLAILTTNLGGAIDPAFRRRFAYDVQFPFPDAAQRQRIWRNAFPAMTPTAALDFARLAQLRIAGGNIRSIAINCPRWCEVCVILRTMTHARERRTSKNCASSSHHGSAFSCSATSRFPLSSAYRRMNSIRLS